MREHGPDDFRKYADNALGMVPFIIEAAIAAHGLTLEGKIKIVGEVQAVLAAVQDSVARSLYVKQLAERLEIEESAILEKVRGASAGSVNAAQRREPTDTKPPQIAERGRLELQIVGMMLCYPRMIPEVIGRNLMECFEDDKLRRIALMVVEGGDAEQERTADLVSGIEDPYYRSLVAELAMSECHWDRQGCERLLAQFESRNTQRQRQDLQRQIESAEKENNMELLSKLLRLKQQQAAKGLINS